LLLIGRADEKELSSKLFETQRKTTREINYNLWSESEFKQKENSAFWKQISKEKKVFLIGGKGEI
jgi:hypothetical protein